MPKYLCKYHDKADYEIEADSKEEAQRIADEYWAQRVPETQITEIQ